ncbi:mitochondrial ribosomal protein L37-domain-containing protein [Myxozyma melibiosi]|uniref:Large ribosomal subunit protein mL54 n=1 Tax=Myxozyma melibiosi TaxID=54550 RepID=A0ABR1F8K2_9ASCO
MMAYYARRKLPTSCLCRVSELRRQFTSASPLFFQGTSSVLSNRVPSSAPEGTRLTGCNVFKNKDEPLALADEEYPDWLWEILDPEAQQKKLDADPERKAKREWRARMRRKIKTDNFLKTMS